MAIGFLIEKVSVKKSIFLFVLLWDIIVPVDLTSGTIMSQQSLSTHSCESIFLLFMTNSEAILAIRKRVAFA